MVDNPRRRDAIHAETCVANSSTPIRILPVHEEAFVKWPHAINGVAPNHQASSGYPIHCERRVALTLSSEEVTLRPAIAWERTGQPRFASKESRRGCWKRASGTLVSRVRVEQVWSRYAGSGVRIKKCDQFVKSTFQGLSITIQEQEITPARVGKSPVIGSCKAKIGAHLQDPHSWPALA
jgi:hypothetical protein